MASHRHKRDTDARRTPRAVLVAGPLAVLATASAVTLGVLAGSSASDVPLAQEAAHAAAPTPAPADLARDVVSRSSSRLQERLQEQYDLNVRRTATLRAVRRAHERLWTTTALNLWSEPGRGATKVGLLEAGTHVLVTGRKAAGRAEVVVERRSRWVTAGYLSADKPAPEHPRAAAPTAARTAAPTAPAGLSMAPCPDPGVEDGLTSSAVYVYRSVCHAFPEITSYGGWDAHGEHSSGKALDIMTTDHALGDRIAAYLQAHASELHLYDVIWWDRIWTPERASEGWRAYGDHGSPTANHMDHVHVATY